MDAIELENAAYTLVTRAACDPVRVHVAGQHLAKALEDIAGGPAALRAGLAGRRWEPWGELAAREGSPNMRMTQLAARFPTLVGGPGLLPWNACLLDDRSGVASSGEHWAISFLLWVVWNPSGAWRCTPFSLGDAWRTWDDTHRAAARSWLDDPFIP